MRNHLLLAAGAVTLTAAPAFAQDRSDETYSGVYVAVSGGYDIQSNDIGSRLIFDRNGDGRFNDAVTGANGDAFAPGFCNGRAQGATRLPGGCERDRNRGSIYGRIGVDRQMGNFVVGALGEFGTTGIKDYTSGFTTTPASYVFERGVTWEASGRLRAGYTVNNGLFYATGGLGYARLRHRFTTTNTANTFTTALDDRDRFGFIVGGGVEYKITRNISIGAEYTYHDYKDSQYLVRVTQGSAPATNAFVFPPNTAGTTIARSDPDFRWHSLRAVVGFRF